MSRASQLFGTVHGAQGMPFPSVPTRDFAPHARAGSGILLVGTPGTGKRALGHYLAQANGFVHLDFGDRETREGLLGLDDAALSARLERYAAGASGVVITWSAGSAEQLKEIRRLRRLGVDPVWLDSDKGAACQVRIISEAGFLLRFQVQVDRHVRARRPLSVGRGGRPRAAGAATEASSQKARTSGAAPRRCRGRARRRSRRDRGRGRCGRRRIVGIGRSAGVRFRHSRHGGRLPAAGRARARRPPGLRGDRPRRTRRRGGHARSGDPPPRACCAPGTWFFVYPPPSDPVGAAVEFRHGRVVAVYAGVAEAGWHHRDRHPGRADPRQPSRGEGRAERLPRVRRVRRQVDPLLERRRHVDPDPGGLGVRLRR